MILFRLLIGRRRGFHVLRLKMCRLKSFAMCTFVAGFGGDCFKIHLFVESFVSPTFVGYVGGFVVVGVMDGGAY